MYRGFGPEIFGVKRCRTCEHNARNPRIGQADWAVLGRCWRQIWPLSRQIGPPQWQSVAECVANIARSLASFGRLGHLRQYPKHACPARRNLNFSGPVCLCVATLDRSRPNSASPSALPRPVMLPGVANNEYARNTTPHRRCVPTSVRISPTLVPICPIHKTPDNFGQIWPNLERVSPRWTKVGQSWPTVSEFGPSCAGPTVQIQ